MADEREELLGLFPQASNISIAVALNGGFWLDETTWSTNEVLSKGGPFIFPMASPLFI